MTYWKGGLSHEKYINQGYNKRRKGTNYKTIHVHMWVHKYSTEDKCFKFYGISKREEYMNDIYRHPEQQSK